MTKPKVHPYTNGLSIKSTNIVKKRDTLLTRFLGETLSQFEARDGTDREDIVADWLAAQSTSWIATAIVLGTTFAAMVLFALSRT